MTRDYKIELAGARDAHQIALMSRDLIEHGLGWSWRDARVLRSIRSPNSNAPIIRVNGHVAAFGIMHYRDTEASLLLFAVRPEYWRKGMATALLDWLLETALVAGIEVIQLEARVTNSAGRALYESRGFEVVDTLRGYYEGRESAVRMELKVAATVG
ncbi:MAG: GNAT family N-acetyltransferase [Chromatiales bacterium]|jgi:ribosomal protein S18 acetylase RimI-like enzyme|nr:GNAT family N-acetyltransferase [Chromatiales bacterium]